MPRAFHSIRHTHTGRTYAYDLLCAYRWMNESALQAQQITGEDMLGFIDYQQRGPLAAPSTINRRLRLLQRLVASLTGTTPLIPAWEHQTHALSRTLSHSVQESSPEGRWLSSQHSTFAPIAGAFCLLHSMHVDGLLPKP